MSKILPTNADERKATPVYSGCVAYFPLALAAVAKVSAEGSKQHHPDAPLHWDRAKSSDELDAMMRHVIDGDWASVAWRALAHLQKLEEAASVVCKIESGFEILEPYPSTHVNPWPENSMTGDPNE